MFRKLLVTQYHRVLCAHRLCLYTGYSLHNQAVTDCYQLQIWHYDESKRQWAQQGQPLKGHTDWVRDVAWAPNVGMPMNTIASAGQDGKVLIWTEQNNQWDQLVGPRCPSQLTAPFATAITHALQAVAMHDWASDTMKSCTSQCFMADFMLFRSSERKAQLV